MIEEVGQETLALRSRLSFEKFYRLCEANITQGKLKDAVAL